MNGIFESLYFAEEVRIEVVREYLYRHSREKFNRKSLNAFLPQHHRQQRNLSGCDTLNPCGLAEGGGADFGEAKLGFFFQAVDLGVVEVGRDSVAVHAGGFANHDFLALDVAFVFQAVIQLLPDGIRELGAQLCGQLAVVVFGAANPGMQLHALVTGGLGKVMGFDEEVGFLLREAISSGAGEADLSSAWSQAQVAIVLTKQESILSAGGEQAVGFGHALGHKIVDEHAEIGLATAEDEGRFALHFKSGIGSREQALTSRLFVTGGAIDLASEVESGDTLRFQRRIKLGGRAVIILHCVAGTDDLGLFQTRDAADEVVLYLIGQGSGDPIDIELAGVATLRFQENLVPFLLRKAHHLVLDRRTITRPNTLDPAAIHRRLVQIRPDNVMCLRVRVGDPAGDLFHVERYRPPGVEGELGRAGGR